MRRPPKDEIPANTTEWMATYSDLVTLLFTFFVLLFAISQVDVQKFNTLVRVITNKGADPTQIMEVGQPNDIEADLENPTIAGSVDGDKSIPATMQDVAKEIQEFIEANGYGDQVQVSSDDNYVFIRFTDDMLFGPNSAEIRPQDYKVLYFIGKTLMTLENDVDSIRVDGHTAAVPNDNYPVSDRDLSSARSNAVVKYLEGDVGIRGEILSSYAFGKYRPIADNETEEGRAKNRRIELWITKDNEITEQLDNIYEKMHE